jgi:hypothetical protein
MGLKISEKLDSMNKDERSLILYLETCLVDKSGCIDARCVNKDDWNIMEEWRRNSFIKFGRIAEICISGFNTHWVTLSDEAWEIAHLERRRRSERVISRSNKVRLGIDK